MSKPRKQHWEAVKWILWYLTGTIGYDIVFESQSELVLMGYADSDYTGGIDSKRSTTGLENWLVLVGLQQTVVYTKKQSKPCKSSVLSHTLHEELDQPAQQNFSGAEKV
nr:Retrovirus-related Pol polyprotein from transposon TNT 1-94 [Ipomoea batatas]